MNGTDRVWGEPKLNRIRCTKINGVHNLREKYSPVPNCRKNLFFRVNFGFLRLKQMMKHTFFEQILDVVSFTTDHE